MPVVMTFWVIAAAMAALASIMFVGRRRIVDKGPHSIPLVALGTGFFGFLFVLFEPFLCFFCCPAFFFAEKVAYSFG